MLLAPVDDAVVVVVVEAVVDGKLLVFGCLVPLTFVESVLLLLADEAAAAAVALTCTLAVTK